MTKYIPKVGEAFEFYSDVLKGWYDQPKVLLITDKEVVYLGDNGRIAGLCLTRTFRPIRTKSDVELDELIEVIYNNTSLIRQYSKNVAIKIQQAGFTIHKKVKRSDIADAIYSSIGDVTDIQSKYAANKVCKLLGDLVEQDDKGGVE
jgi:ribosome-interacting GTPase 1